MLAFPYYILVLFVLHQRILAADGETNGTKLEEEECGPTISEQLSETMDLVCEVNSRLNTTEVYLDQLKKELIRNRESTDAFQAQLKKHLEKDQQIQDALSKIYEHLSGKEQKIQQSKNTSSDNNSVVLGPRDCSDIRALGFTASGVYPIYAGGDGKRMNATVYCDFSSVKESWLVIQRRINGSENFERLYTEYEKGFGNLSGEFWLGNEKLSLLTMNKKYKLRIELEDFAGEKRWAEYATFSVGPSTDKYRLNVGGYSGNAGDSLTSQNNMMFSAKDADNDLYPKNCAQLFNGGWWYNKCHYSNLNGLYRPTSRTVNAVGIYWYHWKGPLYSLKAAEMKIQALK